jgi:plasmid stabilization system protein ParE
VKWPRIEPGVVADIEEAVARLRQSGASIEAEFAKSLKTALNRIAKAPRRYALLETNRSDREIRRAILWRFNYLVIYKIDGEVVAVQHASRRPDAWQRGERSE